ncbi:hypothetical protein AA14362_0413 [Acetobacter cerevisiae DSM 14362]|nr:hypothetical protein AA14362_0413 [Acetobacter cerevisiae DSM 14362]
MSFAQGQTLGQKLAGCVWLRDQIKPAVSCGVRGKASGRHSRKPKFFGIQMRAGWPGARRQRVRKQIGL